MNRTVLMSGADYFDDGKAINPYMNESVPVNREKAIAEHTSIKEALQKAGVTVHQVPAPANCQDGIYTANWALIHNNQVLLSRLPNVRQPEEPYAEQALRDLGLKPRTLPSHVQRFSGQGDALAYGNTVFVQSPYRTTTDAHPYLKDYLKFDEVIALQTKPLRWFGFGPAKKNRRSGLPDSPTYDLDLALAVLKAPDGYQRGLIAYCPDVFKGRSQKILKDYAGADKIEVSKQEALKAFALNLVSTGETVIMNSGAPHFQAAIEAHGLKTVVLELSELRKGGGSIRCSTLSLDN